MRTAWNTSFTVISSMALMFAINACEEEPVSIYQDGLTGEATPVVTTVTPDSNFSQDGTAFAGVGMVTIAGENFSAENEYNVVFFDGERADVWSATETSLRVRVPDLTGDSIEVRVGVQGAYHFGEYEPPFPVVSAVEEIGGFDDLDPPMTAVAGDNNGNVYAATASTVYQVKPDTLRTVYNTTPLTGINFMKMGPDGYIYFSVLTALSRVNPPGVAGLWYIPITEQIGDMDFGADSMLYIAGKSGNIYQVDINTKAYSADSTFHGKTISNIRIFDGDIYVATTVKDTADALIENAIWKASMGSSPFGAPEMILDLLSQTVADNISVSAITFSEDDEMFIANNNAPALLRYSNGMLEPFYNEILSASSRDMTWGSGDYLYIARNVSGSSTQRLVKVNMLKGGAPYYGRQ